MSTQPGSYNLTCFRNARLPFQFTFVDGDAAAVDLSVYSSVVYRFFTLPNQDTPEYSITGTVASNVVTGELSAAQTKALYNKVVYYKGVFTRASDGEEDFLMTGRLFVSNVPGAAKEADAVVTVLAESGTVTVVGIISVAEAVAAKVAAEGYAANLNRASIEAGDAGKIERIKADESGWENKTPAEAGIATETYVDDKASLLSKRSSREIMSTQTGEMSGGVIIRYDDGNDTDYTIARPLHEKLRLPYMVLPYTANVGSSGGITWQNLIEMHNSGLCEIGNHTRNHFALTSIPLSEAKEEIENGWLDILENTGIKCRWFVAPFAELSADIRSLIYRLHRKNLESAANHLTNCWNSGFVVSRTIAFNGAEFQDQQGFEDQWNRLINDISKGVLVNIGLHRINPTHPTSGPNIGIDFWEQVMNRLVEESVPVLHPTALGNQKDHNLIDNPSFENQGEGWSFIQGSGVNTSSTTIASDNKTGAECLQLLTSGGTSIGTQPRSQQRVIFPIQNNIREYKVTMWVKTPQVPLATTNDWAFRISVLQRYENNKTANNINTSDGEYPGMIYREQLSSPEWTKIERTFTLAPGVRFGEVYLHASGTNDETYEILIDDVSIIPSHYFDYNAVEV